MKGTAGVDGNWKEFKTKDSLFRNSLRKATFRSSGLISSTED